MSWEWMTSWRGLMPRSWASVEPATPQPVALVADPPVVRHEDVVELDLVELGLPGRLHERVHARRPSACMSTMRAVMPCWRFGASGSLRVRQRPQSANWAYDVQTLRPRDPVAAVDRDGAGGERGQVAAGVGLAEELAPQLVGREDPGQEALLLLVRAVGQQRGPDQVDADAADQLGRPGPGQLLDHDVVLERAQAAAAVLLGPGDADPAVGGQLGLPAPPERDRLGQVVEARREPDAVGPGQVLHQPGPERAPAATPAQPWRADPCAAAWHSRRRR